MSWPPKAGELLPRAAGATGVREKLAGYTLDPDNERAAAKARGFELILGLTLEHVEQLEAQIRTGTNPQIPRNCGSWRKRAIALATRARGVEVSEVFHRRRRALSSSPPARAAARAALRLACAHLGSARFTPMPD